MSWIVLLWIVFVVGVSLASFLECDCPCCCKKEKNDG